MNKNIIIGLCILIILSVSVTSINTILYTPLNYSIINNNTIPLFDWSADTNNIRELTYNLQAYNNETGAITYNNSFSNYWPVSYYPLEGNGTDEYGLNNATGGDSIFHINGKTYYHGELVNSPTLTTGKYGTGYNFGTTGNTINISNLNSILDVSNSFSINTHFRLINNIAFNNIIVYSKLNANNYVVISYSSGIVFCGVYDGITFYRKEINLGPNYSWNNVGLSWDTTNINCYVNNVTLTNSLWGGIASIPSSFNIGSSTAQTYPFNGTLDEIRIWSNNLSKADHHLESLSRFPVRGKNLIASYSFEKNNATHTFDTNPQVLGVHNNSAVYFDGVDDYIRIPLQTTYDDQCVSFYFKANNLSGYLLSKSTGNRPVCVFNSNKVLCAVNNGTSNVFLFSPVVNINQWYHVGLCWVKDDKAYLYIDGILKASGNLAGTVQSSAADYFFGIKTGLTRPFNGTIDEVRIFSKALTSDEVKNVYQNSSYSNLCPDGTRGATNNSLYGGTCDPITYATLTTNNITDSAWNKWRVSVYNGSSVLYSTPFSFFYSGFYQNYTNNYLTTVREFDNNNYNLTVSWLYGDIVNSTAKLLIDNRLYDATRYQNNITNTSYFEVITYRDLISTNTTSKNFTWYYNLTESWGTVRSYIVTANNTIIYNNDDFNLIPGNNSVIEYNQYGYFFNITYNSTKINNVKTKLYVNGSSAGSAQIIDQTIDNTYRSYIFHKNYRYPLITTNSNITNMWMINLSYNGVNSIRNFTYNVSVYNSDVGLCGVDFEYPILNLTYKDELDDSIISVNNTYDVTFNDGTRTINMSGNFPNEVNNTFCTNLNPSVSGYNWRLSGTFSLSKSIYISRVYSFDPLVGLITSNNPATNQTLYLIKLNDSQTVVFNWRTIDYQAVDGTMQIYKCQDDGSKVLVNSIPILSGEASANLILLTQTYSYNVIIGSTTYTQDSFSVCHVESALERTYIINTIITTIRPVLGLFMIDCTLTKINNDTVKMVWSSNEEDPTDIQACIVGKRRTITGLVEVYRNCSTQPFGVFTRTIPYNGNDYYVSGELIQNGITGLCRDVITFEYGTSVSDDFGTFALFLASLLILALTLLFISDITKMLMALVVGIIMSFIIGLISLPAPVIGFTIAFIVIIMFVVRAIRRP